MISPGRSNLDYGKAPMQHLSKGTSNNPYACDSDSSTILTPSHMMEGEKRSTIPSFDTKTMETGREQRFGEEIDKLVLSGNGEQPHQSRH